MYGEFDSLLYISLVCWQRLILPFKDYHPSSMMKQKHAEQQKLMQTQQFLTQNEVTSVPRPKYKN